MSRLDRVLAARRPAGVLIGFRGMAASKIEALQCNLVCYAFGRRATSKLALIADFCGRNRSTDPKCWYGKRGSLCRLRVNRVAPGQLPT